MPKWLKGGGHFGWIYQTWKTANWTLNWEILFVDRFQLGPSVPVRDIEEVLKVGTIDSLEFWNEQRLGPICVCFHSECSISDQALIAMDRIFNLEDDERKIWDYSVIGNCLAFIFSSYTNCSCFSFWRPSFCLLFVNKFQTPILYTRKALPLLNAKHLIRKTRSHGI